MAACCAGRAWSVPTPYGVLDGVAMFNWNGSAWTAGSALPAGATLDLSFMTPGTLDPRITFTRASTGTYFDAAGVMQTATTNTPRWDYDPVTHVLRGLLIEEARTNSIRNSTMQGVVPGTPGTLPTNWALNTGASGLSSQIVGSGTESGIPYFDFRFFGTAAAGQSPDTDRDDDRRSGADRAGVDLLAILEPGWWHADGKCRAADAGHSAREYVRRRACP